jgi:2,3-bisphosphoglycerate-independent phosphoglycerate mutase
LQAVLIFIDGIGLGLDDMAINPLAEGTDFFARWLGVSLTHSQIGSGIVRSNLVVRPTDAALNVEGLPQSATGQTSLLTGINAQKRVGGHINGFPTLRLRNILSQYGVFTRLSAAGRCAIFANAFTPEYERLVLERKLKYSATTVAAKAGEQPLRLLDDLWSGQAVYHDITRKHLVERGYGEVISPEVAGEDLARISMDNDFTLFEYFQTDRCGHKQDLGWAQQILDELGRFIETFINSVSASETLLVIASDHGNFEALDRKTHTLNLVPTIAWGSKAWQFASVERITDIVPCIFTALGVDF